MRWRCTCLAWSAHAIGKITAALLERARNALPAAAGHEYVALLARYREYFEHNEFDSNHPWSSRFARRRESAPASKIAFLGFSDSGPSWPKQAFAMTVATGDDAILKYVIRYIDRHTDGWENWVIVEPFLKRCVVHFGHTVDYVSRVLVWRHLAKGDLDTAVWGDILAAIIDRHGRIGNDSEVCWAVYASAILGCEIAAESANHIVRNCGALSIVSILNCVEEGLTGLSVFASARERIRLESANGAFWPVILEWKSRQWRGHKHVNVGNDVIDSLVSREALLFDITRLPLVFKDIGKEDFDVVENAIEDRPSMYDDDAPSDQGEDEDNF